MKRTTLIFLLVFVTAWSAVAQDANIMFNKDDANLELLQGLILQKVNEYRSTKKLNNLANDQSLWEAANLHAVYLQKKAELSHFQNKRKTKTPFDRVKMVDASFNSVGENVAYVSTSTVLRQGKEEKREYKTYDQLASELVDNWIKSKPHLENIKDKVYTFSGVAIVYDPETERVYAVQVFGGK